MALVFTAGCRPSPGVELALGANAYYGNPTQAHKAVLGSGSVTPG